MALDDVVHSCTDDDARFAEATHRTVRWLDRCIAAHARKDEQNLFAIVQGGLTSAKAGCATSAWMHSSIVILRFLATRSAVWRVAKTRDPSGESSNAAHVVFRKTSRVT